MAHISTMNLPASLVKKFCPPMAEIDDLYILTPANLRSQYSLTPRQWDALNSRLKAFGKKPLGEYPEPTPRPTRKDPLKGRCKRPVLPDGNEPPEDYGLLDIVVCGRQNHPGKQSCTWHWLAAQPIAEQVTRADQRRHDSPQREYRSRVPAAEWPEGERWCSDCQDYVPLFYARGSKCIAHASAAAHASMVKRVYDFTAEDYSNLLAWQRGRCYICRQLPRTKRLAVDHDHKTGQVRGLLCANDEWGCNRTLARVLNDVGMAERLLAYVQKAPLDRMLAGEPSPAVKTGLAARVGSRAVSDRFSDFLTE
jgi:hypothetical protein